MFCNTFRQQMMSLLAMLSILLAATVINVAAGRIKFDVPAWMQDKTKQEIANKVVGKIIYLKEAAKIAVKRGGLFEDAVFVQGKTGVHAALLLALMDRETKLGTQLGDGDWKADMHPERDRPAFLSIMGRLGMDPDNVPVSGTAWYGSYGGAIGCTQTLPWNWERLERKIAKVTGKEVPNPWNHRDCLTAAALMLKENGAKDGDLRSERLAVLRYLAGYKKAEDPKYEYYWEEIHRLKNNYLAML